MKTKSIYLLFFLFISSFNSLFCQKISIRNPLIKTSSLKYKELDSTIFYLTRDYEKSLKMQDTLSAIEILIELSEIYSHNVDYGKSYDSYWEALLLADKSNDLKSKAKIYHGLGWLYGFYKRDDEALKYLNLSNNICKTKLKERGKDTSITNQMLSNYFTVVNICRVNKDYELGRIYMDSIRTMHKKYKILSNNYIKAEEVYLSAMNGDYEHSIKQLTVIKDYFETHEPSYLILIHMFFGDLCSKANDLKRSIYNYEKSLEYLNKYDKHSNINLMVYDSLASVHARESNYVEAYKYLKKGKYLDDEIFGRTSDNSRHLLGIKDKYRLEKQREVDMLKQQRIAKLEQEDKVWLLQSIILVVTIIFLVLFGFLFFRSIKNKHKNEKLLLKERQQQKLNRHKEILELKNKELTESALRIIEKDEFIASIKEKLIKQKDNIDVNTINRILKSIQGASHNNWSEFEARFTTINQSFYKKLKSSFPNLKQTDLKVCALVKLNFSSKDMSKLLGISVESVHTSRHRLRKKLGLNRNENLEEFINSF